MDNGTVTVITADDDAMEDIRELAATEGLRVVDARSRFPRWLSVSGWTLLVLYFAIANYCRFKLAVGLSTVACTCTL